jgi:multiple antibiotic resistance protein
MLTVVLLTDHTHHSIVDQIETVVEIALVLLLTLVILFAAPMIVRLVGTSGVSVIARVMGLGLASLAVHNAVLAMQALQLVIRN